MPIDTFPNQEFLKFISIQNDKNNLQNLELLLSLEKTYPEIFIKAMSNFKDVKSYRESLDENGKPIKVSWEEALKRFYLDTKYERITAENSDIAQLFSRKGLSQETFDKATELRKKAKDSNIPEHILGKPLKEDSILESIEKIKEQTEKELAIGKQTIEELYDKKFTYEWLNKYDPHNNILGLFCSCCATISSAFYGKGISTASVIAPDVQNIVVRDPNGEIISKGTMYVNKAKGYAVINEFELNSKYRYHEISPGRYGSRVTSSEIQDREMIFQAFQRGLRAFIKEYDIQNPTNPLKQINIGMGYNRLKAQIERFEESTSKLAVPPEYDFFDAMTSEQYILYKRTGKQIRNGGDER